MEYSSLDRLGRQFIKTSSHQTSIKKTGRLLSLTSANAPTNSVGTLAAPDWLKPRRYVQQNNTPRPKTRGRGLYHLATDLVNSVVSNLIPGPIEDVKWAEIK
jgi:hypothetical protein